MTVISEHNQAEVIVVGAGIIGGTLAGLLGQAGLKVLIMDSGIRQVDALRQIDARVFALTVATKNMLEQVGVWQRLDETDIACFRKMHVWDEHGSGAIKFDSAEICQATMGYIVPHQRIVDALQDKLLDTDNIRCLWSVAPAHIEHGTQRITLITADALEFNAKLIVAADGGESTVRNLAGIAYHRHDYKQSALACTVMTEFAHAEVARQRFLTRGPLAFLPLADPYQCAVVWSSTPEHIRRLVELDEADFASEITAAFANELGQIQTSTERVVFPLYRARAERYTQPRIALVGDSAHTIHPLAGLGANLGLLDAATLAEAVINAVKSGRDPGRMHTLRRYERRRKGENQAVMYLLDGFKNLFESRMQAVARLRNLGLALVDSLPVVKNGIMKRAMGITGDLPTHARR